MTDRWAVALALAAGAGALRPAAIHLVVTFLPVAVALLMRKPMLLCVGVVLLTSSLGHRALAGLDLPGGSDVSVRAEVTLLTDPRPAVGGLRAEALMGRRHVELRVSRSTADVLEEALAGERFRVVGSLGPPPEGDWAVSRHLAGRLRAFDLVPAGSPTPVARFANTVRRTLLAGAWPLDEVERSLYTGLVVGDDRAQPAALADSFRGAGLTHLLAVSGQNVVFVLALAGPLLRRLRLWPRLWVSLALIGGFVVLTRAEPSIVRAGAMAALAASTVTVGRPMSRLRGLSLAVAGLLIVDPLLVRAIGFRLSLAATVGIVVLAAPLARRLRGPPWLAEPLAVTLAAQVGVAPFLVSAFGPMPLASIPANLLAVPAAGAVMAWGMSAGLVAGLVPQLASAIHLPTQALLWWVELVATRAAAAPLGSVDGRAIAVATAAVGLLLVRHRPGLLRWVAASVASTVVLVTVVSANAPPPLRDQVAAGIVRWHSAGTDVVVLGGASWRAPLSARTVLESLREAGVDAIDMLVIADAGVGGAVVGAVVDRHPTGAVVVPGTGDASEWPPAALPAPATPEATRVGGLLVNLVPADNRLVVEARPAP